MRKDTAEKLVYLFCVAHPICTFIYVQDQATKKESPLNATSTSCAHGLPSVGFSVEVREEKSLPRHGQKRRHLIGRLALKDVIEQGWKQLQSGFLNQLRQTIEGPLVYVYMSGGHHVLG